MVTKISNKLIVDQWFITKTYSIFLVFSRPRINENGGKKTTDSKFEENISNSRETELEMLYQYYSVVFQPWIEWKLKNS